MARIEYFNHNTGRWEPADSQYSTGSGGNVELDAIYDLAESGYIDPIIDTDNSVFIDETGNIYIY